jgi:hypothetical protein
MLNMIWQLIKIYGGKLIKLILAFFKAKLISLLWKWGVLLFLMVVTIGLAIMVFR